MHEDPLPPKKSPYILPWRHIAGVVVQLYSFFNLSARWGGWSTLRPGCFTLGNNSEPGVKEAGLAAGPVCTATENHAPNGIRSPRPLACWDLGFESHRGHGYLSVVSVVCCQVEVSATSWSLVLPTVLRRCVWSRNIKNGCSIYIYMTLVT